MEPALPSHLWILGQLLASREFSSSDKIVHLYTYILSVCCRKIGRRLTSEHSQLFFGALEGINNPKYEYSQTPSTTPGAHRSRTENEAENQDRRILRECIPYVAEHPTIFNSITKIPHLIQTAKDFSNDKSVQLYNPSTYREFHRFLLELLQAFREIVSELSCMSQAGGEPVDRNTFHKKVTKGRLFAFILMRIARSQALQIHFAKIEPSLVSNIHAPVSVSSSSAPVQDVESNDDELEAIRLDEGGFLGQNGVLAKRFGTWVLLMIIQFDAIEILVTFVDGPTFQQMYKDISIKILLAPTTSRKVLPWAELFDNGDLFPATAVSSAMTNAQIKDHVSIAIDKASLVQFFYRRASDLKNAWKNGALLGTAYHAVANMLDMANTEARSPMLIKDLGNLKKLLAKRQGTSSNATHLFITTNRTDSNITNLIKKISPQCPEPTAREYFFLEVCKPTFEGTLHCEAYLASLLENYTKSGTNIGNYASKALLKEMEVNHPFFYLSVVRISLYCIQGYGRVIGVSKRCCPTCYYFLDLLITKTTNAQDDKFLVRGRHPNVTGCSLPPWTPPDIVKEMNLAFGGQLRMDLIALLQAEDYFQRPRASSIASESLSVDSNEGPDEGLVFFTATAVTT